MNTKVVVFGLSTEGYDLACKIALNGGDVQIIDESITTISEQRATTWMPFASLQEGLHEKDPKLTKEGYPAPRRVVITAKKN